MELKEFISKTLKQIVDGVIDAQDYVKNGKSNAVISPRNSFSTTPFIDFDIAVTSDESESTTAGAGITVVSIFKAKGEMETGNREQNISRVRFKVPIRLPNSDFYQP